MVDTGAITWLSAELAPSGFLPFPGETVMCLKVSHLCLHDNPLAT